MGIIFSEATQHTDMGVLFLPPYESDPPNGHGRSRDRLRWVQRGRRRRGWRVLCTSEQSWQPRGRVSDIANPSFPRRRSETDLGADPCPPVRLPVPSFLPKTVIFSFSRSVSKAGISTSSTSHSFRSGKGREIRALSFREILFLYFSFTYLGFFFCTNRRREAKRRKLGFSRPAQIAGPQRGHWTREETRRRGKRGFV